MFGRLFPQSVANTYGGHKAAPRLFGLVVAMWIVQIVNIIFNGYSVVKDADVIPLSSAWRYRCGAGAFAPGRPANARHLSSEEDIN